MAKERTLTDVSAEELKEIVKDFESEGATVETTKQPNGLWTVKATWPE